MEIRPDSTAAMRAGRLASGGLRDNLGVVDGLYVVESHDGRAPHQLVANRVPLHLDDRIVAVIPRDDLPSHARGGRCHCYRVGVRLRRLDRPGAADGDDTLALVTEGLWIAPGTTTTFWLRVPVEATPADDRWVGLDPGTGRCRWLETGPP